MEGPKFTHIAVEGIDGSGKDTQIDLLADHLRRAGHDARTIREPSSSTEIGRMIRDEFHNKTLDDMELNVLFAADRLVTRIIMSRMVAGMESMGDEAPMFVSSRSVWSAFAYHGLDNPMHEFLSPSSVVPDLTVVLDITVDEAMHRLKGDLDRFEASRERLTRARENYLELAGNDESIVVIDAHQAPYLVAHNLCKQVDVWLENRT